MKLIITTTMFVHRYVPQNPRLFIRNTVPLVVFLKNLSKIYWARNKSINDLKNLLSSYFIMYVFLLFFILASKLQN